MAVIHDVMPAFELFQPATIGDVVTLLNRYGSDAWIMAGGMDSFDWLKDRIKRPSVVIDLSQVESLRGIKALDNGLEIGAGTTLTEIVRDPLVREKFGLLAEAAELVASPQIRNQGTIGGNVSQDTRCWYYRAGWSCYRAGGNICYADTPTAINREHAILGADRCVAVNPSDTAPALVALDAQMVVQSASGDRDRQRLRLLHRPAVDITRMTVWRLANCSRRFRIRRPWAGAQFYFEKGPDRNVWDFRCSTSHPRPRFAGLGRSPGFRIVINAAAARPLRLHAVEAAVVGKPRNEQTAELAGQIAIEGAQALRYNAYKIPLMRNLVKRAIRGNGSDT
jgi:xanthine dehydrogenase YagS FAD-binding subunit